MRITSLDITGLRVIEQLKLVPGAGINLIVGDNGAGKTSILEAVYLAGRGRTFRHADAGPLIRQGSEWARVVLGLKNDESGRDVILGVKRQKRSLVCRVNGEDVHKRSILAEALPVQWIGSQPQLFLEMGPEVRRRFIDMGLFHVEQSMLGVLSEFQRTLRQRNAAIRTGSIEQVRVWNEAFANIAEVLDTHRQHFVHDLMTAVKTLLDNWQPGFAVGHRYRSGWNTEHSLHEQLTQKIDADMRAGYTIRGPQRAELELLADGVNAEKKLSRGQQKILVLAINLVLADMIKAAKKTSPILLIDDLAAELDRGNREQVMTELFDRESQVFLTQIDEHMLPTCEQKTTTFHVEHGALK